MNNVCLKKLLDTLKLLAELELTIGEFYKTCAEKWSEDEAFWTDIYKQEYQHARYMGEMSDMIASNPDEFVQGRNFNPAAINTFILGIRKNIELVKSNKITKTKALHIASDIEKSALENTISEIVKTNDLGFLKFERKIFLETEKHKERFDNRIAKLKAGLE